METAKKQSKEDYLKRYLSGYTEEKKKHKKKKKQSVIKPRTTIVDDDVDIAQLMPSTEEKNDVLFFDEVPQVAEIVDERPLEEIELERYRTGEKWRMIDDEEENEMNVNSELTTRHDSDSDQSPLRTQTARHDSDSDQSPPRRTQTARHDSDSDQSPPRRKNTRHDSDSDQSPPRRKNIRRDGHSDKSPLRKKNKRNDSDSDQSPPRKKNARHDIDSDQSPPRRRKKTRNDDDSDQSPPRRRKNVVDGGSEQTSKDRRSDSRKLQKTLSGLAAGLQNASSMRVENEKRRMSEKAALDRLDNEVSGKNAGTVYRDKSGRKRDLNMEKFKHKEEQKKQEEESKQFKEWGRGVAQTRKHQKTVEDHVHEISKPFARYEGDGDLEVMLKDKDREGDPMLAFLKKKAAKANLNSNVKEKPKYKGPAPPPNRFNITPGYRWDGVDRTTGFEKKYFERLSNKKAMTEVKYKWNVEDM